MTVSIIDNYKHLNSGTIANIIRILNHGKLAKSGKFMIFDADFVCNNPLISSFGNDFDKYSPEYYFELSSLAGFSAIMGNIGVLESISSRYPFEIPLILRLNSGNSLNPEKIALIKPVTALVKDALRIGASAVCFTIYVASDRSYDMIEDLRDVLSEAHECGLPVIVEIMPKGGFLSRIGEASIDIIALAIRMASELGADIIKAPYPNESVENPKAKKGYDDARFNLSSDIVRLNHLSASAFGSRRLVGFNSLEIDNDKTFSDIKNIAKSECEGFFIGASAIKKGILKAEEFTDVFVSVMAEERISSEMPLFKKD